MPNSVLLAAYTLGTRPMKTQNQPMTEGQFRAFMATSKKQEAVKWQVAAVLVFFAGGFVPFVFTGPVAIGLFWWSLKVEDQARTFESDTLWEDEKWKWGF